MKKTKSDFMDILSRQGDFVRVRKHFFVLFGLLFLSSAFFVSAADELSGKNIVEDPDQDGLTTEEEQLYRTDPMNRDTDGDGYTDGVEVKGGYDPLKKAPGDKIVAEKESNSNSAESFGVGGENLTEQTAQEIVTLIQDAQTKDGSDVEVSLDDLNTVVQNLTSATAEEIVLPDVDMDAIKIKKKSCKKLSEKKCDEKTKDDIVEYLTVIAYIFANNSPEKFETADDLEGVSDGLVNDAITALSSGNMSQLNSLVENGEKMLAQIYDVEVPEKMLDTHVKAIKLAKYAVSLKDELSVSPDEDPVKMIASLSKTQGFLNVVVGFVADAQSKIVKYGIDEISVDGF